MQLELVTAVLARLLLLPEKKKKKLSTCRGEGSVVGPLLAARALLLRCAASTVLNSTPAMPNC
jgi:hypothetical protein